MNDSEDVVIDIDYEFSAPKWFDFIEGESDQQIRDAQLWVLDFLGVDINNGLTDIQLTSHALMYGRNGKSYALIVLD
uniref:Protein TPX2-like n=1 Tax=Tanacetum cinerariifolium TaxID=118510 RepID=A0A6L2K7H1_TANCI|nr:protein TPX2-like [Tanacetum cinerariifolium]